MRLDQQLAQTVFSSRSRAKDAIQEGRVSVNGKIITKCSFDVSDQDDIAVADKENDLFPEQVRKCLMCWMNSKFPCNTSVFLM